MFKSVRWRGDKDRIKAVFKLQFHATQVTETKLQALIISVIPDDGGKLIRTLEKATVHDGNCRWENPVYETVKFVREPKTGKINERIYHFVLSTISIQRLHENDDQREVEETEDACFKLQDRSLKAHLSDGDADESIKKDPIEDTSFSKTTHNIDLCGNNRGSNGSDITISSSNSSSGLDTPRELGMRNDDIKHEWCAGSDHGMSTDDFDSSQDTFPLENSQQGSHNEIERLKNELIVLSRQVDVSDLELQTLRKQIVKESKRGQDLSREVVNLKEERDALKLECNKLKASQKEKDDASVKGRLESGDPWVLVQEIKEELKYEKDLNSNLRLQLQKTQESNAELLLAVQDLEEVLDAKNRNISRSDTYEDEDQRALEHLVHEYRGTKETSLLEQKLKNLYSELEICKRDKDELEAQMEQLALDYEILKQENHVISYKLEQTRLREQLRIHYECPSSSASLNELENQIECLQSELSKQSKEFSDSLATINELETHVRSLEEVLEKQAQIFERDLESITQSKVEQEQRTIRAEEALRTTRLKNAKTAERLQEEFQRLSMQMASTFDAKEKVATSALAEASALRLQKNQLEEMLKKANEELESVWEDYEGKLSNLSDLVKLNSNQIAQMLEEIDDKSKQLEDQKKLEGEVSGAFSEEICTLKTEIDKLTTEKNHLCEQAEHAESLRLELEHTKALVKGTEVQMQRGNLERNNLVSAIALMKKEATESQEKLQRMRYLKDEKEAAIESLQSELDTLKGQCDKLKHSLLEDEIEKEELRKQVVQLKTDLKKKEDAFTGMEKKLKGSNGRGIVSDGTTTPLRNNKSAAVPCSSKEVASLRETMKLLEGQIKIKEADLETSTNVFLENEKDLRKKIDELENRVELNEQRSGFCNYQLQKVRTIHTHIYIDKTLIYGKLCNIRLSLSNLCFKRFQFSAFFVTDDNLLAKEQTASIIDKDGNQDEWRDELASLKERNKSMENELKDMQERYSEISLKFAEVEGERQKLVMTVRNLMNAKKS
ncbi:protein LURP-one-related 4-like [Hibiscus syriacus]|uniref:Protein LURP-one-related 4-like n=1 Tax=Hibiscus syriacus TaxID=106335 RepID=A0A6A3B753_HIBSY|nr:protein LURP-one-related 4-like [Hibiscus syriacus]